MSDKSNDVQNKIRVFVEKRRRVYRKKVLTGPESARRGVDLTHRLCVVEV